MYFELLIFLQTLKKYNIAAGNQRAIWWNLLGYLSKEPYI